MAKAIEQTKDGLTIGHGGFGEHGKTVGSAAQAVHDGDTIVTRAIGTLSVRFLGIDTPEVSFTLPGSTAFTGIGSPDWAAFLTDPFAANYVPLALDAGQEIPMNGYMFLHPGLDGRVTQSNLGAVE